MSGGYIQCGKFAGDDKSGSAISGVLEELPRQLPRSERDVFIQDVISPIESQLEATEEFFNISPAISERMLPVVESLFTEYKARYGDSEPWEVIELESQNGADSVDLKWGKGAGWRYYCLTDLRTALEHSIKNGDDILVHFD